MPALTSVRVTGLGKQKMSRIAAKAKRMGVTPAQYIKQLVDDDLESDRIARTTSLATIVGPALKVDESELDELVNRAKRRHYRQIQANRD